jgi:hypothetical protein
MLRILRSGDREWCGPQFEIASVGEGAFITCSHRQFTNHHNHVIHRQDAGLLYHQYRNLRDMGYGVREEPGTPRRGVAYSRLAFTPTSVDKARTENGN